MQVNISGHQLDVTDALRDYIDEKFARLSRHFDRITNVQVTMAVEKLKQKIEATLHVAGAEVVANAEHEDMYAAIDLLADKLDRQRPAFADHIQARHAMFMRNVGVNGTDTCNGCDHRHGQGKRSHISPPKNIKMFRKTHHLPGARSARDQIASIAPRRAGLAGCS